MKRVLITGGSGGIGAATAKLFAKKGFYVIINYNKSKEKADKLANEIGGEAICADVSDPNQVKRMFDAAGEVDILINNAGISLFKMADETTDEEWKNIMAVNLNSVFYCSREVIGQMIHRRSGSIVNVSSMWGICGASCESAYSAAKAGVIGFTKALAAEVASAGIRVNCIAPGAVDTEMNRKLGEETIASVCEETPLGRLGTPEEIAKSIFFLAEEAGFATGQVFSPNGGLVI